MIQLELLNKKTINGWTIGKEEWTSVSEHFISVNLSDEYGYCIADCKFDGCVNLNFGDGGDKTYVHICELKEHIAMLQSLYDTLKYVVPEDVFEMYYE